MTNATTSTSPRINGARVFGVRPGSPVLHTIAATGQRPIKFAAEGLPKGLHLDAATGRISGVLKEPGTHEVVLSACNDAGTCQRALRIVVGDKIALTPPMGWNSWNCWGASIDQQKVLAAAKAMVASKLVEHGWSYVNIDDGWQGSRNSVTGALDPNDKFHDMAGLCETIHSMGLKVGIYSTPWAKSYAGYTGGTSGEPGGPVRDQSKGWYIGRECHDEADARQWAQWGIDYLKFDWGPMDLPSGRRMRKALLNCGRDIVLSATNAAPEEEFAEWSQLAECYYLWRRVAQGDCDIADSWKSISSIGFRMGEWAKYVAPGHWNDPDMLVVGQVGWGKSLHPSQLTHNEQYTHISLWCLLAAPLLLGCDLTQLDPFTIDLLTNDEVLEVNQDPLGKMARCLSTREGREVWIKPMEEGTLAIGLFNRSEQETEVSASWADIAINGHWRVRDLWRHKDMGTYIGKFEASVPAHGVSLIMLKRD
jgi:alpha-galactosidase